MLAGATPVLVHNCGTEDFAHGTNPANGSNIVNNGLSEAAANASRQLPSKAPGSFFTVPVDPADPMAAVQAAQQWGMRAGGQTCVVICRLPKSVVATLEQQGLLVRTEVPVQAVFDPRSYPLVNQHAEWILMK